MSESRAPRSAWCSSPLALLTSGQVPRFAYKTAFSLIRVRDSNAERSSLQQLLLDKSKGRQPCLPNAVDAFIVLSQGKATIWTGPNSTSSNTLVDPSSRLDVEDVRRVYKALGVRRLRLRLLTMAEMQAASRRIESAVAARGAAAIASTPAQWLRAAATNIPRWSVRWRPHSRMFYLRHLAFRAALDEGVQYRHFLYVREDNAFLDPAASLAAFAGAHFAPAEAKGLRATDERASSAESSSTRGVVAVDEQCGWGSYSDKLFLANAAGASALFAGDEDEHVAHMSSWVQLALLPPMAPQRLRPFPTTAKIDGRNAKLALDVATSDPLQTEYFLQTLLLAHEVDVHPIAFHRTDVRRLAPGSASARLAASPAMQVGGGGHSSLDAEQASTARLLEHICVPDLYWNCRKGAHMRGLARCHDWNRGEDASNVTDAESTTSRRRSLRSLPRERHTGADSPVLPVEDMCALLLLVVLVAFLVRLWGTGE